MSRRTREDELAARVQVAAVILGVLIIYALAAWFGYTHPAGNSWAIPALFVALLALSAAAAIRAASRAPHDETAPPSRLDLAHREAADHARAKRHGGR